MKEIENIIKEFGDEYGYKIVYITQYGSKLFGTDNPNSDTDYKGIFIPSQRAVLLKKDIEHYNYNSNATNTKNGKEDVDLQLYSIYKWFNLLKKGETGALDLLFSLFREDTQEYVDEAFVTVMQKNYKRFYNRHLHSFVGYCVGQSKLYNVRGQRFNELHIFVEYFASIPKEKYSLKLEEVFDEIENIFESKVFNYIKFVMASVSRGNDAYKEGLYVEVLGKKFRSTVSVEYFAQKIKEMEAQFGNRSRSSAKGVDWKALSHAVRVINEVEELLDDEFITFPLLNREYIKSIKEGRENLEEVMDYLDKKLDIVQNKLQESKLPEKSDEEFIESLILDLVL
ncbi:MAG: nucleotidyltransferase domain-containing protein [Sulfurovum sp.]